MVKALFDTNILIDYLNGKSQAEHEIASHKFKYISVINYIEVLVGINNANIKQEVKKWLLSFKICEVDIEIAEIATDIRQKYGIKVPDALILATAHKHGIILVTRNTKDFRADMPYVYIPYVI